jgi:hypothetical protein
MSVRRAVPPSSEAVKDSSEAVSIPPGPGILRLWKEPNTPNAGMPPTLLSGSTGNSRPSVPILHVPRGTTIGESFRCLRLVGIRLVRFPADGAAGLRYLLRGSSPGTHRPEAPASAVT